MQKAGEQPLVIEVPEALAGGDDIEGVLRKIDILRRRYKVADVRAG